MGFFQRLRNAMYRFMYGRNGVDQLGMFLVWGAVIVDLANMFIKQTTVHTVISVVTMAAFIWEIFRMFSKNLQKRRAENAQFLQKIWWPLTRGIKDKRQQRADRDHKYFTCPNCKAVCRVPVGKGKVVITCPRCGGSISGKT